MSDDKMNDDSISIITENLPVDELEEVVSENGKTVRRKGVYLLPNMVTTGALFGGFFAIISAMNNNFAHAALAIFAAQLFDGIDGRVARMTKTESAFGTEYDSLSDMVSFGLAPAVVMFSWGLEPLGKIGWAAAFVFVACAALRLARFNTQVGLTDKKYFIGLASPPAATLLASGVWCGSAFDLSLHISIFAACVTAFVGFMMISNFRYQSFKSLDDNRRVPFVSIFITILVCLAVALNPPIVLFTLAFAYALSGPLVWVFRKLKGGDLHGEDGVS